MEIVGLLPILTLLLMFYIFSKEGYCWRISAINAAVVWGVVVAISTEMLSAFDVLTRGWVLGIWVTIALLLFAFLGSRTQKEIQGQTSIAKSGGQITREYQLAIWAVGLMAAITGLIAFMAPPNTWDSMAYHMARVAHWIQNGTVRHYSTIYLPQLYHPPWAEFAIAHLQILSNSDRFANSIQWLSMVGCVLGVSLIAKLLGADCRAQVFSSVLIATIPMGIMQASSTQNDFVVAFWLVCFVVYVLRILTKRSEWELKGSVAWEPVFGAGASLGLALLTKGTAYIYSAPFVVWFTFVLMKRCPWRALQAGIAMVLIVAILNGGHFFRNVQLFGFPLTSGGESYLNELWTPSVLVSNIIRNISLHMGTPFTVANVAIEKVILWLHGMLGIAANDPRTSAWLIDMRFSIHRMDTVEDFAGNPLHVLMISVSIAAFIFHKSLRAQQYIVGYLVSVLAMFLLFNLLLKWQPWHSRLHLPMFVLFAPFVGIVTLHWCSPHISSIMAILLVASLPWALANQTRSLVPVFKQHRSILTEDRLKQYFPKQGRPLMEPYIGATAFLRARNLRSIGLMLPYNPFEYQLWVLLKGGGSDAHLEHVEVDNVSSSATALDTTTKFIPEAIISVHDEHDIVQERTELRTGTGTYQRAWSRDQVEVYLLRP